MTILIGNGTSTPRSGWKRIVLSPEGEIRPVQKCIRNGLLNQRHSQQACFEGDIAYEIHWDKDAVQYTVGVVETEGLDYEENLTTIGALIHDLPEDIREWLSPVYRYTPTYLPAGMGWDGVYTRADMNKYDRLKRFFYNLEDPIKEVLIENARLAPGMTIPTLWKEAQPLPLEIEMHPGSDDNWEAVITWDHQGSMQVVKSTDTTLCQMTNAVRKAMYIIFNAGHVQWSLFKI